ncbi:hypothetical protein VPH35_017415 [Triticum aestivum]
MSLDAQRSWMYSGWKDTNTYVYAIVMFYHDCLVDYKLFFAIFILFFSRITRYKMTIGRKASRLAVAIKLAPVARNTTAADGTYDGYVRGVSDLPPAIPNNEDRPIIRPFGKTHWKDILVVRKGRRPASVLTCLLKSNHPGILDYDGVKVIATEWEH